MPEPQGAEGLTPPPTVAAATGSGLETPRNRELHSCGSECYGGQCYGKPLPEQSLGRCGRSRPSGKTPLKTDGTPLGLHPRPWPLRVALHLNAQHRGRDSKWLCTHGTRSGGHPTSLPKETGAKEAASSQAGWLRYPAAAEARGRPALLRGARVRSLCPVLLCSFEQQDHSTSRHRTLAIGVLLFYCMGERKACQGGHAMAPRQGVSSQLQLLPSRAVPISYKAVTTKHRFHRNFGLPALRGLPVTVQSVCVCRFPP